MISVLFYYSTDRLSLLGFPDDSSESEEKIRSKGQRLGGLWCGHRYQEFCGAGERQNKDEIFPASSPRPLVSRKCGTGPFWKKIALGNKWLWCGVGWTRGVALWGAKDARNNSVPMALVWVGFPVQWSCSCVGFCEARVELVCAGCSLSSSRFHTLTVCSGVLVLGFPHRDVLLCYHRVV